MVKSIFILLFINFILFTDGANILGIFTVSSPSHNIVHLAIVEALAERGHNVTVVTALPLKKKNPNYNHIYIKPPEEVRKSLEESSSKMANAEGFDNLKIMISSIKDMTNMQYNIMYTEEFQNLIHGDNKFDLLLFGYVLNDFQLAIAQQLKIPVVASWVNTPNSVINGLVGNPVTVGTEGISFSQRLKSFFAHMVMHCVGIFSHYKLEQYYEEYKSNMNLVDLPSYDEMRKNVSLVISNSHFTDSSVRPIVPAFIEVGGIQVKPKPNPLDQDLKEFLDNSEEHGAIFFSMGSNVKVSSLHPEIVKVLYNVLSNLKQNVVWKWEDPLNVPGNSKNIFFRNWLPQDDILAHKSVKLFITHGGKGSVVESQYHGVPMIALPAFADQGNNAENMVQNGYGLKLNYQTMTEKEFMNSIEEIFNNITYTNNVQSYSKIYKDRPMSSRDTAVFWIEYVIRHNGAVHMQSPLVHMNAFTQYSLDVIGFLIIISYIIVKIFKFIFKKMVKVLFKQKKD